MEGLAIRTGKTVYALAPYVALAVFLAVVPQSGCGGSNNARPRELMS